MTPQTYRANVKQVSSPEETVGLTNLRSIPIQ